jgi:hypothetical protein
MRALPDVVGGGPVRGGGARRLLAPGLALAAVIALAGCAQFDSALGQQQAVVVFRDGASLAQRLAVRTACAKPPAVVPQPLPSDLNAPYALQQLTYQTTHASDAQVAELEECLAKFPVVAGVTLQDSSDEGN